MKLVVQPPKALLSMAHQFEYKEPTILFDWSQMLRESPLDWLLEETNPSVRYFTLRDIIGKNENDREVAAAKQAISNSSIVRRIMKKQHSEGYWEEPTNPYHPKYKSSYWTLMVLSQFGLSRTDDGIEKACEYIFQFQTNEGGFSTYSLESALKEYEWQKKKKSNLPSSEIWMQSRVFEHQYSCLTGNMSAALIKIGYPNDSRVWKALHWLARVQNKDGGWLCPYWKAHAKDKHGCFYGTICPLETFSEVGKENLTQEIKKTVERGAEFLLMHRLFKADHHGYKVINKYWLKLGFPMFYGYNILRGLDLLTKLGYVNDERLNDAVDILLQKRQKDGSWLLETGPVGRMHANIETKGKPSKWITLMALRTLKRLTQD